MSAAIDSDETFGAIHKLEVGRVGLSAAQVPALYRLSPLLLSGPLLSFPRALLLVRFAPRLLRVSPALRHLCLRLRSSTSISTYTPTSTTTSLFRRPNRAVLSFTPSPPTGSLLPSLPETIPPPLSLLLISSLSVSPLMQSVELASSPRMPTSVTEHTPAGRPRCPPPRSTNRPLPARRYVPAVISAAVM